MLFTLLGAYRKMKTGTFDAKDFAVEQAMDAFKGFLVVISVIALPIIIFIGILGFTDWIISASSIAKFFFWLLAIMYTVWFAASRVIYKRMKRGAEKAAKKIIG